MTLQKQVDELKWEFNILFFMFIVFVIVSITVENTYMSDLQSQLSHKADRICVNETYISGVNLPCKEGFVLDDKLPMYCIKVYPNGNYESYLIYKFDTKEVCTIK